MSDLSCYTEQEGYQIAGQRVPDMGAGESNAESALDLAEQLMTTTIASRVGVHVLPRTP